MKEILRKVTELMAPNPVYLVGGSVRDFILGKEPKDYDFCTPALPDEIEKLMIKSEHTTKKVGRIGKRFGTLSCKLKVGEKKYIEIEITTFRSETYGEGRKPSVEFETSLEKDLGRRDFTINAIALRLNRDRFQIIDIFEGQNDLRDGVIRAVGNPKRRFKQDPLRILRGIRFASRFGFTIEKTTASKMKKYAIELLKVSKERWVSEFDKILLNDNVGRGLRMCWDLDIFKYTIPYLHLQNNYNQNSKYHDFKLDEHTIKVVEETQKGKEDINMLWSALLHDIAKPFVASINRKGYTNYIGHEILGGELVYQLGIYLKWTNQRREEVTKIVSEHLLTECPLRKYDNMNKRGIEEEYGI